MKSIKKNYLYSSFYQILNMILPLITAPYVSRVLGAENIGQYTFSYSVANYFVIFAMLGISNYGNRSCAKVRDNKENLSKTFWSIYVMQIVLGIVLSIIYFVIFFVFNSSSIVFKIQMFFVLSAVFDVTWFFYGVEDFKIVILKNVVVRLLSAIAVFIFVKSPDDLVLYTLILSAGVLIGHLVTIPSIKKYVNFYKPTVKEVTVHIKPNLILFIPVIAVSLYKIMDKVMLGSMVYIGELGYYEYAEKLTVLPLGLINSLGSVMLPRMSNLTEKKEEKQVNNYIEKSMIFVIFLSSAMAFGLIAVGENLVPLLFGNEYVKAVPILYCLVPSMIFVSWANVIRTQYLIPRNKDKEYIISVIIGAIVNTLINLIYIPILGGLGAAIGTLVAEFSVCIIQSIMVFGKMNIKDLFFKSYPFIIFGFIMCACVLALKIIISNIILLLIIQIILGVISYIGMSYVYLRRKLKWKF